MEVLGTILLGKKYSLKTQVRVLRNKPEKLTNSMQKRENLSD